MGFSFTWVLSFQRLEDCSLSNHPFLTGKQKNHSSIDLPFRDQQAEWKSNVWKKQSFICMGEKLFQILVRRLLLMVHVNQSCFFLYLRGTDLISIYPMTNKMSITTGSHFDVVQYTSAKHSLKSLLSWNLIIYAGLKQPIIKCQYPAWAKPHLKTFASHSFQDGV